MPELPEVETIRRKLARKISHKSIDRVEIRKPKLVRGSVKAFVEAVSQNSFSAITRRGKLMAFHLADGSHMLLHLKMTGQLIYVDGSKRVAGGHEWPPMDEELPNRYSHIFFTFSDGSRLFFNDLRQFGYVELVDDTKLQSAFDRFGIEPASKQFTFAEFQNIFSGRTASVKALLLNQSLIAGLGNIYVDEACHAAGIRPTRRASTLTKEEKKKLYSVIPRIISTAIAAGGTTFSNAHHLLKVYGRKGEVCTRKDCKASGVRIKKTKVAGRGTYYCPRCQK